MSASYEKLAGQPPPCQKFSEVVETYAAAAGGVGAVLSHLILSCTLPLLIALLV